MKGLLKSCSLFYYLTKKAEEFPISRRVMHAIAAYKKHFDLELIPGPIGSMGQIFFLADKPDLVIKFTTDSAEARNMMLIYQIQSGALVPSNMTEEEIETIKEGVIKVFNVFAFDFGRGRVFVIEQERGKDLPMSLSRKLLETIGGNISKQPDEVFKIIQDKLSDPEERRELSKLLSQHLIDKGKITLEQEPDVDVGDLGRLLRTVRSTIDASFRDFRPSNMVVTKQGNKYKVKLIDLGYGAGATIDIPTISI